MTTEKKTTTAPAKKAEPKTISIGSKAVSVRGRTFTGVVTSDKMAKTVTVEWPRKKLIPKYQRYEKRRTRVKAHNELGAKTGDTVEIQETRPLSKTKNFIVTKIIKSAQ
ncbi:30S ribosomal protein S17 [Candidatus Woesearchaeota archaeon]|nr:30S ribosomal protein S17 [Candidatus Woesearchaeota archaeon]